MRQYIVTSTQFNGELIFSYDLNSNLTAFDIQAELTPLQRKYFFNHLPMLEVQLTHEWPKTSKTLKVIEVPMDLSFDAYYKKYDCTFGDKKKAKVLWEKLSDANKTKCHILLPRYNRYLERTGVAKIYLERFISKGYYDNDYK